jgi:hypothetical protein
VIDGSSPSADDSEKGRQCRTPPISTPTRSHCPARGGRQPCPGWNRIVATASECRVTPVTTPPSCREECRRSTIERKSAGLSGYVSVAATRERTDVNIGGPFGGRKPTVP